MPLSALKEERQRRQQMAAQLEQERAQHLALQQQVNQYLAQQQQAEQAAQIPDFADDPEGHVKGLAQQFEQRLTDMQGQQQQVVQQQQVQQTIQAAVQAEAAAMERFGEADYRQASALVEGNVMDQLRTMHPGAPEWQLQQVQAAATVHFVRQCQAQGLIHASTSTTAPSSSGSSLATVCLSPARSHRPACRACPVPVVSKLAAN